MPVQGGGKQESKKVTRGRWEPASLRQVLPNEGTKESIGTRSGELGWLCVPDGAEGSCLMISSVAAKPRR